MRGSGEDRSPHFRVPFLKSCDLHSINAVLTQELRGGPLPGGPLPEPRGIHSLGPERSAPWGHLIEPRGDLLPGGPLPEPRGDLLPGGPLPEPTGDLLPP